MPILTSHTSSFSDSSWTEEALRPRGALDSKGQSTYVDLQRQESNKDTCVGAVRAEGPGGLGAGAEMLGQGVSVGALEAGWQEKFPPG